MKRIISICVVIFGLKSIVFTQSISVLYDSTNPNISFAANELYDAFTEKNMGVSEYSVSDLEKVKETLKIILTTKDYFTNQKFNVNSNISNLPELHEEGYSRRIINKDGNLELWIIGGDYRGTMYGCLDLVEVVQTNSSLDNLESVDKHPYVKKRGIKFNIPLDARTPSYSDNNPISQPNIENMWDMNFWKELLDEMAFNRLNLLTLWTTTPFPSMVRIPEYPLVGLDDVKKTTIPITEFGSRSNAANMVNQKVLDNLETIKSISLDDKIVFWQKVMQYASDRGVDIYIYTWNVFVFGTEDTGYGFTDDIHNEKTRDYIRKATKALIKTYPLLKGIGITAGENLSHDSEADEKFLFETYGQGINDILNEDSSLTFQLIHRLGNVTAAKNAFKGLNERCKLSFCYKYSKAHVYSSVSPYWIRSHKYLEEIDGSPFYITVRDDSYYYLRGGSDPDFTRAYIKNIPNVGTNFQGFQLGPDAIVWGREYVSKNPMTPNQLIFNKRWFSLRLWGKLAYDPNTPNSEFIDMLRYRFPEVNAKDLFTSWSVASRVVPLVNRFHNHKAYLDYQWNPEICDSRAGYNSESGFHDVNTFIRIKVQPEEGLIGIPEFIKGDDNGTTPFDVAKKLLEISNQSMNSLNKIDTSKVKNKELLQTLSDIKAMSYLGGYYSYKISGSTNKAFWDETKEIKYKEGAISDLQKASDYWWKYSHQLHKIYKPIYYSRLKKNINLFETQKFVDKDITDLGGEIPNR